MNALSSTQVASDSLERELKRTVGRRDEMLRQLAELEQTDNALALLRNEHGKKELDTRVNLGEQFYVRAKVPLNTESDREPLVVLDLGRGVLAEMQLDQASKNVQLRREWLQGIIDREQDNVSTIKRKAQQLVKQQQ